MSTPNFPVVNLGNKYIQGLNLSYIDADSISVAAGQIRDSSNTNDIVISSAVTLSGAVNGVINGLDTGSLGASTIYYVYAVGDSTKFNDGGALLSLSSSQPSLPFGYDMYRRIGAVRTDGSSDLLDFTQRGNGLDREMWYAEALGSAVTAGNATSMTAVDLSAIVPVFAGDALIQAVLTADAGAVRNAAFAAYDSSSAAGQVFMSAPASNIIMASLRVPVSVAAAVVRLSYLVSNSSAAIDINVSGYVDQL
jgi:hypothetical protein